MANKVLPEIWVEKFIKSATKRKEIPPRLRRLLTIVVVCFWLTGLGLTSHYCYKAAIAFPKYKEAKNDWRSYKEYAANYRLEKLQSEVKGFYSILYFLAICFIIPWLILRLIYWVLNADRN